MYTGKLYQNIAYLCTKFDYSIFSRSVVHYNDACLMTGNFRFILAAIWAFWP